jgi:Ca2+:H+ antiporter
MASKVAAKDPEKGGLIAGAQYPSDTPETDYVNAGSTDDEGTPSDDPISRLDWGSYLKITLNELFLGSKMNILLLATPFAIASDLLKWGEWPTFCLAMLALIPFAERVSFVTEEVAKYTNDTVGGLLNATFGNITELILNIMSLKAAQTAMLEEVRLTGLGSEKDLAAAGAEKIKMEGYLRFVQVTMLGSVLSNLLLVLGSAFLVGGLRHSEQQFNKTAAVTNSGLLVTAVLALSLPSILDETHNDSGDTAVLNLSRFIATIMLSLYCLFICFQLKTHTHLFQGEDDEEEEAGILGFWGGIFWLSVITCFISILSDYIVDTVFGAAEELGLPVLFLSGILVPIVGNAAEHAAAIVFAWRNKMEISLGSAVGSAVQIAVFVIPFCVIVGWYPFGLPMTLDFHIFETIVMLLTVLSVAFLLVDGNSHWLKGAMLIFCYFMIAAAFCAHKDPPHSAASLPTKD